MAKKKPKVLIIEDDQRLNKIYTIKLLKEGMEIVTAVDGEEGLRKIYGENPDLIILDLMLPKKDGFEILKEIKENKDVKNIPVIILSNLGQDNDIKRGLELGAVDFLVKIDYSIAKVVEKIKNALNNSLNKNI